LELVLKLGKYHNRTVPYLRMSSDPS